MNKSVSLAVLTAAAAVESVSAAHASSSSASMPTKIYKGPTVQMNWGPVRAVVYVRNKKITKVAIMVNPQTNRSQFIDDNAIPILQQETLQAQNGKIDAVSGATMTSEAYIQSLQKIMKKARQDKLLK